MRTPPTPRLREAIVVVEDDERLREVLRFSLETRGWDVHAAAVGERGLALARTCSPAVVVTDLDLPGISGLELAAALARDSADRPPVIAISGADERVRQAADETDLFSDVLSKPFRLSALVESISRACSGRTTPGSGR